MSIHLQTFQRHRARLFALAYRMLGMRADAEDVLQDAWLKWEQQDVHALQSCEAWLVTVVTRLAIDRLRRVQAERAAYVGSWLPEPLVEAVDPHDPESLIQAADDLSMALVHVLASLKPEERAAYLMRQVLGDDYAEVALLLGKSEAACRQLVHRAEQKLKERRPAATPSRQIRLNVLQRFVQAVQAGPKEALQALLAEDATLISDGGGKVAAVLRPLWGRARIADLFDVVHRRHGASLHYEVHAINGEWGLLRFMRGQLESVLAVDLDGEQIQALYVVRNPDKLPLLNSTQCHKSDARAV